MSERETERVTERPERDRESQRESCLPSVSKVLNSDVQPMLVTEFRTSFWKACRTFAYLLQHALVHTPQSPHRVRVSLTGILTGSAN